MLTAGKAGISVTKKVTRLTRSLAVVTVVPLIALAQAQPPARQLDDISISPSRVEVVMAPGTEKTLVVNVTYSAGHAGAQPARVIAYLGDWSLSAQGRVEFYRPGARPESACSWLVHSPTEATLRPGTINHVRVTISVPKDATPGDHLAALFIEPRPDNIKLKQFEKRIETKFRLAAIFYVMVPGLTRKGSLESLKAEASRHGIVITPRVKNEGNTHIRPAYSVRITDRSGVVVAELPEVESLPVLAHSEMELPVVIEKAVPPGSYVVNYRVNLGDGSPITEGRTDLIVKEPSAEKAAAEAAPGPPVRNN